MLVADMTAVDLYSIIMLAMVLIASSRLIYERYKAPGTSRGAKFVIWIAVFMLYLLPAGYGALTVLH